MDQKIKELKDKLPRRSHGTGQTDADGEKPAEPQTPPIERSYLSSETDTIIQNETDSFIQIERNAVEPPPGLLIPEALIIAPFGSRTLDTTWLRYYKMEGWKDQRLITTRAVPRSEEPWLAAAGGCLVLVLLLFLAISIPVSLINNSISGKTILFISGGLIAAIVLLLSIKTKTLVDVFYAFLTGLWNWVKLLPGMALVLATGIGLPLAASYVFGDGKSLLDSARALPALGRLIQLSFISLAAMLPALLFYMFGRQQVDVQKENFYKEVMALDPNVHSLTDARTKYAVLIDSVYGSGSAPLSIVLLIIGTALLVMGWIMTLGTIDIPAASATSLLYFFTPVRNAFTFGFLGAYFFTLNMIFRRYVRADLTPKTYAHITVRLLITIVLVWVVGNLPQFRTGSAFEAALFTVAFAVGVIPETGLTLIQDYVNKFVNFRAWGRDVFSLDNLEGIHLYDRARLLEEGIENIENLVHHNMIDLIARTRIPTSRLVDLFDQGLLYLHLGQEVGEKNKAFLYDLKSHGIRTATDLDFALREKKQHPYQCLARIQAQNIDRMEVILRALRDDDWYQYLLQWRSSNGSLKQTITNPYTFYSHYKRPLPARQQTEQTPVAVTQQAAAA